MGQYENLAEILEIWTSILSLDPWLTCWKVRGLSDAGATDQRRGGKGIVMKGKNKPDNITKQGY